MRCYGLWNSAYPLSWGTFSEAMHVIRPAYEEALAHITARLANVTITVENQDLWNYIERQKTCRSVLHTIIDGRSSDPRFHAKIEAKLSAVTALKFRFTPEQ